MGKLVNSLLFLARADSNQQTLETKDFFLDAAVSSAAEPFEPLADSQGIYLIIARPAPILFSGDEAKLRQVIAILLDNALRHTPAGGEITVSLSVQGKNAILTVSDTGEGIPPAHIGKIFDRFYQADKSRARGGSGLGLAIAKWIVESHEGRIQVSSAPGAGTKFTVSLPLS